VGQTSGYSDNLKETVNLLREVEGSPRDRDQHTGRTVAIPGEYLCESVSQFSELDCLACAVN